MLITFPSPPRPQSSKLKRQLGDGFTKSDVNLARRSTPLITSSTLTSITISITIITTTIMVILAILFIVIIAIQLIVTIAIRVIVRMGKGFRVVANVFGADVYFANTRIKGFRLDSFPRQGRSHPRANGMVLMYFAYFAHFF